MKPLKLTKYYQFELRGVHALTQLGEPTHGHHCSLRVGLEAPITEADERSFLLFMKEEILKHFDKADWKVALSGKEPSGENVAYDLGRRLKQLTQVRAVHLELQETKKNIFSLKLDSLPIKQKSRDR